MLQNTGNTSLYSSCEICSPIPSRDVGICYPWDGPDGNEMAESLKANFLLKESDKDDTEFNVDY